MPKHFRIDPTLTPGEEFKQLRDAGYTGSRNDMMFQFLVAQGYSGSLVDMLYEHQGSGLSSIVAVVTPSGQLFDGEDASTDLANFSTFDNTTNYTSAGNTITSVDYQINGITDVGTGALADGDVPSFLVTDSAANTRRFTISTVTYAAAVNTVAPVASGSTSIGDVLSVTNGTWTGAVGGAYTYQWYRDATPISGATSSSYTIVEADDNALLSADVIYTNSGGTGTGSSNGIQVDDFAVPTVTASDALVSRDLTITVGTLTGNPTPTTSLTTLTLDGVDVLGDQTGSGPWVYAVPSDAAAQTVAWEVTATNAIGSDTASGSEVVSADLFAPVITGVPTISGTETVGSVLTATESAGGTTGNPTPTLSWQWVNSASGNVGTDSSTYTLQASDEGDTITVVQTETNAIGVDTATSASTGTVTAVDSSTELKDESGLSLLDESSAILYDENYAGPAIPANAIQQRDAGYVLDRATNYIETRV